VNIQPKQNLGLKIEYTNINSNEKRLGMFGHCYSLEVTYFRCGG